MRWSWRLKTHAMIMTPENTCDDYDAWKHMRWLWLWCLKTHAMIMMPENTCDDYDAWKHMRWLCLKTSFDFRFSSEKRDILRTQLSTTSVNICQHKSRCTKLYLTHFSVSIYQKIQHKSHIKFIIRELIVTDIDNYLTVFYSCHAVEDWLPHETLRSRFCHQRIQEVIHCHHLILLPWKHRYITTESTSKIIYLTRPRNNKI